MPLATLAIDGPIAALTLSGRLDGGLVAELERGCAQVADDPEARVLLISGETAIWAGWSDAALADAESQGLIGDPFAPLAAVPQPVIAVLEGAVADSGLELALCADIRIAGSEATFALPGIAAGTFPMAGGLQRLSRAVGRAHALELALNGQAIDAPTAQRWGLVSALAEEPSAQARSMAERIAARGPLATRLAKEAVRRGAEMPLDQALRYETDLTVLLQTTADRAEGVRAFQEKRPPRFHGR